MKCFRGQFSWKSFLEDVEKNLPLVFNVFSALFSWSTPKRRELHTGSAIGVILNHFMPRSFVHLKTLINAEWTRKKVNMSAVQMMLSRCMYPPVDCILPCVEGRWIIGTSWRVCASPHLAKVAVQVAYIKGGLYRMRLVVVHPPMPLRSQ